MTRLLRVAAVAVLVGGAAAVLSSCSNDPGAIVTTTPTAPVTAEPVSSPSPTPSVTPEEELLEQIPENARGEDFFSATQFARFFLNLYPELFAKDGSSGELFSLLAGENCGFCNNALDNMDETRAAQAYSVGSEFDFSWPLAQGGLREDGYTYVTEAFSVSESVTYGPSGEILDSAEPESGLVKLRLEYADGHWVIDEVDFDFDEDA
ncbi:hypothetical protein LGT39_02235 [Demequina sp. TTPB684]|uniref:hypothetical protein n=1 Tax=unclassified Demequina TaxID=2620311 RepID=UPI001CF5FBBD|nr:MULTISPECIES: hypothetical protein [unclassified Demequina]MCB2411665.1 hypothetical protein [Demequina sp. TTPB684]UPU88035.1 hypothetical protein LGT36_012420 [Demequina sp. TMPB413]